MRGADVVASLEKWGFNVDRVEGSHHIMEHPDGRGTTVPVHNRDVAKGTMGSIMQDTGLTAEQLRNPEAGQARGAGADAAGGHRGERARSEGREVRRQNRPRRRTRNGETASA